SATMTTSLHKCYHDNEPPQVPTGKVVVFASFIPERHLTTALKKQKPVCVCVCVCACICVHVCVCVCVCVCVLRCWLRTLKFVYLLNWIRARCLKICEGVRGRLRHQKGLPFGLC